MATLKEHQAAMVDLLASGSGIPASASRLAHAMHDVLSAVLLNAPLSCDAPQGPKREQETTPGLNDKALSKPQKALKTDSPAKWPTPAEQRVKELENTIKQLKSLSAHQRDKLRNRKKLIDNLQGDNAKLRGEKEEAIRQLAGFYGEPEQAGCRKPDTQVCDHEFDIINGDCGKCGVAYVDVCHQDKYK